MRAPRVTIEKPGVTPTQELIANAAKDELLKGDGITILVRKPGPLAQFRLIAAVGAELAANQTYMQMINPLIYISQINGEDVMPPMSNLEVEALITRLDDEGLGLVMSWYLVNIIGATQNAMDAATKAAEAKAKLKN
jgi:hypothetical protein